MHTYIHERANAFDMTIACEFFLRIFFNKIYLWKYYKNICLNKSHFLYEHCRTIHLAIWSECSLSQIFVTWKYSSSHIFASRIRWERGIIMLSSSFFTIIFVIPVASPSTCTILHDLLYLHDSTSLVFPPHEYRSGVYYVAMFVLPFLSRSSQRLSYVC